MMNGTIFFSFLPTLPLAWAIRLMSSAVMILRGILTERFRMKIADMTTTVPFSVKCMPLPAAMSLS